MRSLLGAANMSQAELSRATGIDKSTVSTVLNAKSSIDVEQVMAIATAFGIDYEELTAGALARYRKMVADDPDADLGPLVTSRGSVIAASTDGQHSDIEQWADEYQRQARESSTPSPSESSSTEDR